MSALLGLLIFAQALGAVGGAVAAVWAEIAYARAIHDGRIDHAERVHLNVIAQALRYGMSLLLVASLALVALDFATGASPQPALTASYWLFILLALLIITVTARLSRGRVSFLLGSAVLYMAWWFLAYLALGEYPAISFGASVFLYVVAVVVLYGILAMARSLLVPHHA